MPYSDFKGCVFFDWGDTLMRDFPVFSGPMEVWPLVEAMPHALEVLTVLRRQGWMTALATNAADSDEPAIRRALARVGLEILLDKIYCSRATGFSKPSSAFYSTILRDAGFAASSAVMVGDDFESDVLGAVREGIRALWYCPCTGEERNGPLYHTIHDLAKIPEKLEQWRFF